MPRKWLPRTQRGKAKSLKASPYMMQPNERPRRDVSRRLSPGASSASLLGRNLAGVGSTLETDCRGRSEAQAVQGEPKHQPVLLRRMRRHHDDLRRMHSQRSAVPRRRFVLLLAALRDRYLLRGLSASLSLKRRLLLRDLRRRGNLLSRQGPCLRRRGRLLPGAAVRRGAERPLLSAARRLLLRLRRLLLWPVQRRGLLHSAERGVQLERRLLQRQLRRRCVWVHPNRPTVSV